MNKKRVAILTNAPSPYRVDMFDYLQRECSDEYEYFIIYYAQNEDLDRNWKTDQNKIRNTTFLASETLKQNSTADYKSISFSKGLGKALKEIRPDVCVIHEYSQTSLAMALWCRVHRVPYVSWTDGTIFSERNFGKARGLARRFLIPKAKSYIASSSAAGENQIHLGAPADRIYLSCITMDLAPYLQEKQLQQYQGTCNLICVGSLVERKGIDLLLKEMTLFPEGNLTVVGDGPLRKTYEAYCQREGLAERVRFTGFLDKEEILEEYREADAFVLLTREDCYGLVILEAMCSGLPVIVSKYADGSRDLVEEGKTGFVVDNLDSAGIQKAFRNVFSDRYKELSKNSFEKTKEFTLEKQAKGYVNAIDRACAEK